MSVCRARASGYGVEPYQGHRAHLRNHDSAHWHSTNRVARTVLHDRKHTPRSHRSKSINATTVVWKANTLVAGDIDKIPNVIRWGTVYNFRFISNTAPGTHALTLGFSIPPQSPFTTSLSISTLTPSVCDNDGVCDFGESCTSCTADCDHQGGGTGCCGNGICEAGESGSSCFPDCGTTLASEMSCADRIDGDRDGLLDCADTDCCSDAACAALDFDQDGAVGTCDCNDADASDFVTTGVCLVSADPTMPTVSDAADPSPGAVYFYLVRARDACPVGTGPLGSSSSGTPHSGPACN